MREAAVEAIQDLGLVHTLRLSEDREAPLVFMVHGRAGNASVMWAFRRTIPDQFSIIAPEAPLDEPEIGGKSWWLIHDSNASEQREESCRKLNAFVDRAVSYYGLRPRSILLVGFSQGGAMNSLLLQRDPGKFHGVGFLASFVVKEKIAHCLEEQELPEILFCHGIDDEVISLSLAEESAHYLESLGMDVLMIKDPVGHKVGREGMSTLAEWFLSFE